MSAAVDQKTAPTWAGGHHRVKSAKSSNKPEKANSAVQSTTRSALAALQRAPLTSILPPSMACLASERVLKKRAAHNHWSARTLGCGVVGAVTGLRFVSALWDRDVGHVGRVAAYVTPLRVT